MAANGIDNQKPGCTRRNEFKSKKANYLFLSLQFPSFGKKNKSTDHLTTILKLLN